MSKSLGNVYLIKDFIEKGYDPLAYRLFSYSCHYRNKLNFTWEGMAGAVKSLERLKNGYQMHILGKDDIEEKVVIEYEERFHKAINDDLNMPLAMGVVWEVIRNEKKSPKLAKLLEKFDTVLGLKITEETKREAKQKSFPKEILELVEQRKEARKNKDWEKSDELRDLINQKGYNVKDTKEGMEITRI